MRTRTLAIQAVLLLALTPAAVLAGDWTPFAVFPSDQPQQAPDISGVTIVWQQLVGDETASDWDIYGADVTDSANPFVFEVSNFIDEDEMAPAIHENIIVWQDNYYGDWDIYMLDTSAEEWTQTLITDLEHNQQDPDVFGNWIVFQDDTAGDWDVMLADVIDPTAPRLWNIAAYEYDQRTPAIYRTFVGWQDNFVWEENPDGLWNVFAADVLKNNLPVEYLISALPQDQQNVAVWGDTIVWQQKAGVDDWDIWAADISDPDVPRIFPVAATDSSAISPAVTDNLIVWQDDRNGDWDIYGYNLTTRQEFLITDNDPEQTVFSDQMSPAVSGATVVYEDNIGGVTNVYAVVLAGAEVAECPTPVTGDANGDCVVNMLDMVALAQNWLHCGLVPTDACP